MSDRIEILRKEPGVLKLFTLFKEKYRSLGRFGGTVSLVSFSDEEIESIAGLIGISNNVLMDKRKISLLSFEEALQHTVFAEYTFLSLLEETLQEKILTKSEEGEIQQTKEESFIQSLRSTFPDSVWWWDWIWSKSADTRWIWGLYSQNSDGLFEKLSKVHHAFHALPQLGSFERIPIFAQRTTGNPHLFDDNQFEGKLLVHCLYVNQVLKGVFEGGIPKTSESLNELFSYYGLLRDDLWSFITCRGFLAEDINGIHPVWKAAVATETVMNVPIKELLKMKRIYPAKGKNVWIVENSSVCSTMMDEVKEAPILCTHGQFRTASWVMLNLLVQAGCTLYYSGDLDPEGLAMAQRLKDRYQDHVTFWRMDKKSYMNIMSDEDISTRLSKLDSITSPELTETISMMKARKKAGYQEGLIEMLVQDIKDVL